MIQVHIVTLPNPVFSQNSPVVPAETIVTLHLAATQISGVGLTDGTLYQGSMGTSQTFVSALSSMDYDGTMMLSLIWYRKVPMKFLPRLPVRRK